MFHDYTMIAPSGLDQNMLIVTFWSRSTLVCPIDDESVLLVMGIMCSMICFLTYGKDTKEHWQYYQSYNEKSYEKVAEC